jgi:hypothetical protein
MVYLLMYAGGLHSVWKYDYLAFDAAAKLQLKEATVLPMPVLRTDEYEALVDVRK